MGVKSPKCTPEIGYLRKDKRLGCLRHSKKKIVPLSVPHTLSILLPLFSHTFSCLPLFFSFFRGLPSAFKKKKIYFSKHSPLSFLVLPVVSPFLNTPSLFLNSTGSLLPFNTYSLVFPFLNTLSLFFSTPQVPCSLFLNTLQLSPPPFFLFHGLPSALKKKNTFQSHFQLSPLFFEHTFSCLPFFCTHLQLLPQHSP